MDRPRRSPYIWATWIAGVIAGDDACKWAAWYKAHHEYDKRPDPTFDAADWKARHTALMDEVAAGYAMSGQTIRVEDQTKFKIVGRTNITLAGKPDLVVLPAGDEPALVVDGKTSRSARASHIWQVRLYQYALPLARFVKDTVLGLVHYADPALTNVPVPALNAEDFAHITRVIQLVGGPTEPARVPSYKECSFCDIASCPDRKTEDVAETRTEAF